MKLKTHSIPTLSGLSPLRALTHRATLSTALLLAGGGLSACGEMEESDYSSPEISSSEALISASDISAEDLDLQSLALNAGEGSEMGSACSPENIQARGRRHHPQNQRPEGGRPEGEQPDEMVHPAVAHERRGPRVTLAGCPCRRQRG